ncbi:MAG: hypothetical protein ACKOS8_18670, partial [Gemmataceae bacterium]
MAASSSTTRWPSLACCSTSSTPNSSARRTALIRSSARWQWKFAQHAYGKLAGIKANQLGQK